MKMVAKSKLLSAIVVTALVLTVFSGVAAGYSLTPSGSQDTVEVSDRQIDSKYGSATISSASSISAGESVAVEIGVESDELNPNLQIRDQENAILRLRRNVSDGSVQSFDSSVFTPSGQSETTAGTYLISLWSEGEAVAAHPVVVQGYDISVSTPESVEQGDTATITADLSERQLPKNSDLKTVEIAVGNENVEIEEEMTRSDGADEYSIDIDTSNLDAQSYGVYVAVRGEAETEVGENELLAISEAPDLSVTPADDSDDSSTDDGSTDSSDESEDNNMESNGSEGDAVTNNDTQENNVTSNVSEGDDSANDTLESNDTSEDQASQTDSGTIEPTDDEITDDATSDETSSDDSIPGFGVEISIIALLTVAIVITLKRTQL